MQSTGGGGRGRERGGERDGGGEERGGGRGRGKREGGRDICVNRL